MGWFPKYKKGDVIIDDSGIEAEVNTWTTLKNPNNYTRIVLEIIDISIIHRTYTVRILEHPLVQFNNTHLLKWHEVENYIYKLSLKSKLNKL